MLVVDVGSSTTDFAYIMGGKEVDMQTAGEVALGGGIMDEVLLSCALNASVRGERIREIFEKSPPWKSYCEFAARKLKEKYFADEEYWKDNKCMQSVIISYEKPIRLQLVMDAKTADHILYDGIPQLEGRSFRDVFMNSLRIDMFSDQVFAFTPQGKVIPLPNGSTAIDFAFAIHTQVGSKMVGA